jgi:sugar transferase (PEP-CTERM/EpsH1 system associated)
MRILYITAYVPSRIRTRPYHLVRALARQGLEVHLLSLAGTSEEEQLQADEIRSWGVEVEAFPVPTLRSLSNSLLALASREPLQARYAYHPDIARRVYELTNEHLFDVVHIEHLRASRLVLHVQRMPKVYDSVDCISALFAQTAQTSPQMRSRLLAKLDLARTRRYEADLQTCFDHIVITSQRDRLAMSELAQEYLPTNSRTAPITVITNGVDLDYFQPNPAPRADRTLVFTGKMSYHANVAAAVYLVGEVLPLVWSKMADVRLEIVGKDPPDAVRRLAADHRITVTGYVDDLRPYLAHATAAVCPVQYAVGVQNKVLEAMAMSTPTITMRAGCAALDIEPNKEIIVVDNAAEMASAIQRVITDRELAQRLSLYGRQYVEVHHSWDKSAQMLTDIYTGLCSTPE